MARVKLVPTRLYTIGIQPAAVCWRPIPVWQRQVHPSAGQYLPFIGLQRSGTLNMHILILFIAFIALSIALSANNTYTDTSCHLTC